MTFTLDDVIDLIEERIAELEGERDAGMSDDEYFPVHCELVWLKETIKGEMP